MQTVQTAVLLALTLFAVGYAVWVAVYFVRGERPQKKNAAPPLSPASRRGIIGKSRFVLPPRCQPTPVATIGSGNVESEEKADIFAPGNVPQHPRQIPPEKLDEVFGAPPEGERNEADDIISPLIEVPLADYEADMDADMNMDDESEAESQPPAGR